MTFVFGNCSKIILKNTVIGIDNIKPGIPQINPQNISITKIVITFIEKDLPLLRLKNLEERVKLAKKFNNSKWE